MPERRPTGYWHRAFRLVALARHPLTAVTMLLLKRAEWSTQFRVGQLYLSARRSDLGPVAEVAIDDEYGFVQSLPFPDRGAVVLDLGANIGCFAAVALSASAGAEVHSIEPSPDTFALLSKNRQRYGDLPWHVHHGAIGAVSGQCRFNNAGPSSGRRMASGDGTDGVTVTAYAFDEFVSRVAGGRRVFLCKMDIEGAEIPIFSQPVPVLDRIDQFIVEVHGSDGDASMVQGRLADAFPFVERMPGRTSSKPVFRAWRQRRG